MMFSCLNHANFWENSYLDETELLGENHRPSESHWIEATGKRAIDVYKDY